MRRIILESPFAGEVERNIIYAKLCLKDCLDRDEAPFASHLLYTHVLDDTNPEEREQGIEAGLAWGSVADATVVYTDYGISNGMKLGIERAESEGRTVEYRNILSR